MSLAKEVLRLLEDEQQKCPYCGCVFQSSTSTRCPNCGANVKPDPTQTVQISAPDLMPNGGTPLL